MGKILEDTVVGGVVDIQQLAVAVEVEDIQLVATSSMVLRSPQPTFLRFSTTHQATPASAFRPMGT
jgi:hypothetical protein